MALPLPRSPGVRPPFTVRRCAAYGKCRNGHRPAGRRARASLGRCYRGHMPPWLLIPGAILLGYVIWRVGMATLRSLAGPAPGTLDTEKPPAQAEDVEDLDVYLVCGECGAEFKGAGLRGPQTPPP